MEADEVDVLPGAVLRDFEQIEDAEEAGGAGECGRDVGEADGLDGVDLDFTFFHAIAAAGADMRTRPDANRAGDLAVADSFAQTLGELHEGKHSRRKASRADANGTGWRMEASTRGVDPVHPSHQTVGYAVVMRRWKNPHFGWTQARHS